MPTRLYGMPISNAAAAAEWMIAHKRIPHRLVRLMCRRWSWTGARSRARGGSPASLTTVSAERPLFPADPEQRARVEEAERWAEQVLQPVPRRLFRHLLLAGTPGHGSAVHAGDTPDGAEVARRRRSCPRRHRSPA
jgi:hypothetical protein